MTIKELFIQSLMDMNRDECLKIIIDALDQKKITLDETLDLLSESLSLTVDCDLNEIWQEHVKTQIVRTVLENVSRYTLSDKPLTNGKKIAVICPDGEYHELGARLVSEVIRKEGFEPLFFGNSLPNKDITKLVESSDLSAIAFSVSNFYSLHKLNPMISDINKLDKDLSIIIGGIAVGHNTDQINGENVIACANIDELKESLKDLK